MKTKLLSAFLFISTLTFTQAPQGINYQGIARNGSGTILPNQVVSLRISILSGAAGPVLYSETHSTTTNQFGLFTVKIGMGSPQSGTFSGINWSAGNQYARIEIDPTGGNNYINLGDSQLLSVPFALYSETSGTPGPAGPPGPTGPIGPTGNDGIGVDTSFVQNDSLYIKLSDGQTINTGYVRGPTGPMGSLSDTAWTLSGNSGTDFMTDFLGTTDLTNFRIKTNNKDAIWITPNQYIGINGYPSNRFSVFDSGGVGNGVHPIGWFQGYPFSSGPAYAGVTLGYLANGSIATGGAIQSQNVLPLFLGTAYYPQQITLLDNGNTGVGTNNPVSLFSAGSASEFQINSSGNITYVNGIKTTFPSSQGSANTFLRNDGIGNLSWQSLPASWSTSGNTGLLGSNYLGTTDAVDLIFKTNNSERMRITSAGKIGINTASPSAMLNITHNAASNASSGIYYSSSVNAGANGVMSLVLFNNASTTLTKIGIINTLTASGTGPREGIRNFVEQSNGDNSDIFGLSNEVIPGSTGSGFLAGINNVVRSTNNYGQGAYGMYSYVEIPASHVNDIFGISSALSSDGIAGTHYGFYSNPGTGGMTRWAYYGVGSSFASGGTWQTSDERLKTNVSEISSSLDKIKLLQAKSYTFKREEYPFMGLPKGKQYGFLASDLEKVFPEMVMDVEQPLTENAEGKLKENGSFKFKAVNYTSMIPVLVEAIQEQQKIIEEQGKKIKTLEKLITK